MYICIYIFIYKWNNIKWPFKNHLPIYFEYHVVLADIDLPHYFEIWVTCNLFNQISIGGRVDFFFNYSPLSKCYSEHPYINIFALLLLVYFFGEF